MLNLRGSYAGRCWIVGNGPSLAITPLSLLREPSFGLNKIALLFGATPWRPTFLVSTTSDLEYDDYRAVVVQGIEAAEYAWVDNVAWGKPTEPPNCYRLVCTQNETLTAADARDDWWSDDIEERVTKFGSTILPAFQIAAWLGFREIVLVGCDLGYKSFGDGGDPNHFHVDYYPGVAVEDGENAAMIRAHEIAAANCKRLGIRILNATLGGELEVHQRVNYYRVVQRC